MKINLTLFQVIYLLKVIKRISNKSWVDLIRNKNISNKNITKYGLKFLFGYEPCYVGIVLCEQGIIKQILFLLIENGAVKEVGSLKIKDIGLKRAVKETYEQLRSRGRVSKVFGLEVKDLEDLNSLPEKLHKSILTYGGN